MHSRMGFEISADRSVGPCYTKFLAHLIIPHSVSVFASFLHDSAGWRASQEMSRKILIMAGVIVAEVAAMPCVMVKKLRTISEPACFHTRVPKVMAG
jgi:hypothetical protein